MIWLTENITPDSENNKDIRIEAQTIEEAKEICRNKYPGYVVIGKLIEEIEIKDFTIWLS